MLLGLRPECESIGGAAHHLNEGWATFCTRPAGWISPAGNKKGPKGPFHSDAEFLDLPGDGVAPDAQFLRGLDAAAAVLARAVRISSTRSAARARPTRRCGRPRARPGLRAPGRFPSCSRPHGSATSGRRRAQAPIRCRQLAATPRAGRCGRRDGRGFGHVESLGACTDGHHLGRQVLRFDHLGRRHHGQPVADVLELAHVAGKAEGCAAGCSAASEIALGLDAQLLARFAAGSAASA